MNNTTKVGLMAAMMVLGLVAFSGSANADEFVAVYAAPLGHCSYNGWGSYNCQGVYGNCVYTYSTGDPNSNPTDRGNTIYEQVCV